MPYEESKENRPRLSSVVASDRTWGNGHKSKYRKFHLKKESIFLQWRQLNTDSGCPQRLWSLYSWRYFKPNWTWSWRTYCLINLFWEGGWTWWPPDVPPPQPQPFCDSVYVKIKWSSCLMPNKNRNTAYIQVSANTKMVNEISNLKIHWTGRTKIARAFTYNLLALNPSLKVPMLFDEVTFCRANFWIQKNCLMSQGGTNLASKLRNGLIFISFSLNTHSVPAISLPNIHLFLSFLLHAV